VARSVGVLRRDSPQHRESLLQVRAGFRDVVFGLVQAAKVVEPEREPAQLGVGALGGQLATEPRSLLEIPSRFRQSAVVARQIASQLQAKRQARQGCGRGLAREAAVDAEGLVTAPASRCGPIQIVVGEPEIEQRIGHAWQVPLRLAVRQPTTELTSFLERGRSLAEPKLVATQLPQIAQAQGQIGQGRIGIALGQLAKKL
jgi:hypothetical protein